MIEDLRFKNKKHQKGFTLIEMLIYVAIFSVVMGALVTFIQLISQSRVRSQAVLEVNDQGAEISRVITQTLRNSISINIPATSTSASSLSVRTILASTTPTTFTVVSGILYKTEGANSPVALNNSRVVVSNLNFSNLSKFNSFGSVRTSFALATVSSSSQPQYNYSVTFYATGTLK
jgi:prepilin-type N-terminal cleavage/methylation domain-containing protein